MEKWGFDDLAKSPFFVSNHRKPFFARFRIRPGSLSDRIWDVRQFSDSNLMYRVFCIGKKLIMLICQKWNAIWRGVILERVKIPLAGKVSLRPGAVPQIGFGEMHRKESPGRLGRVQR